MKRKKPKNRNAEVFETPLQNIAKNTKLAILGCCAVYISHNYSIAIGNAVHTAASAYGYTMPDPLDTLSGYEAAAIACAERDIDPNLCRAIAHTETRGKHRSVSNKGAIGLMQVMPQTAAKLCPFDDLFRQSDNARCGAAILNYELDRYNDEVKALQAYNGGPRCVGRCKESINYSALVIREKKRLS